MPRHRLSLTAGLIMFILLAGWWLTHRAPAASPPPTFSYADTLQHATAGQPGAARMLYQMLARPELTEEQRITLLGVLPDYPSPQALKIASLALHDHSLPLRKAALHSIVGLVPDSQRSVLLGPLLEDPDPAMRFATARAMFGLSPDDLGLYFNAQQQVLGDYAAELAAQPASVENDVRLADLYMNNGEPTKAATALDHALAQAPDNLEAAVRRVELLEKQHQSDAARQLLGQQLARHPDAAYLQHALGQWLLRQGQSEFALLGLARAVELQPDNDRYRYDLALALHALHQLEPAQKQLEEILARKPANRRARVLLIQYWQETGQLQNVQVLMAELEQQNPDDPALQQQSQ